MYPTKQTVQTEKNKYYIIVVHGYNAQCLPNIIFSKMMYETNSNSVAHEQNNFRYASRKFYTWKHKSNAVWLRAILCDTPHAETDVGNYFSSSILYKAVPCDTSPTDMAGMRAARLSPLPPSG